MSKGLGNRASVVIWTDIELRLTGPGGLEPG